MVDFTDSSNYFKDLSEEYHTGGIFCGMHQTIFEKRMIPALCFKHIQLFSQRHFLQNKNNMNIILLLHAIKELASIGFYSKDLFSVTFMLCT